MKVLPSLLGVMFLSLLSNPVAGAQEIASVGTSTNAETIYPRFLEKSGMQVLSAIYGSGTTFRDVTDETTKLLNQQSRFYARPEWLRTDPTPGWNKALLIVFTYQSHRYLFTCGEGGEVRLPLLQRAAAEQAAAATPLRFFLPRLFRPPGPRTRRWTRSAPAARCCRSRRAG